MSRSPQLPPVAARLAVAARDEAVTARRRRLGRLGWLRRLRRMEQLRLEYLPTIWRRIVVHLRRYLERRSEPQPCPAASVSDASAAQPAAPLPEAAVIAGADAPAIDAATLAVGLTSGDAVDSISSDSAVAGGRSIGRVSGRRLGFCHHGQRRSRRRRFLVRQVRPDRSCWEGSAGISRPGAARRAHSRGKAPPCYCV